MSEIEDFLEEYGNLVIGDEKVAYFTLKDNRTEKSWGTWANPGVQAAQVEGCMSRTAAGLPTGAHTMILEAMTPTGRILGQLPFTIDGRSPQAKRAADSGLANVKGSGMIVEQSSQLVELATARAEMAEKRANALQGQLNDAQGSVASMVGQVSEILMNEERAQLEEEERRARIETIQTMGVAFMPVVNLLVEEASERANHKKEKARFEREQEKKQWKADWEKKQAAKAEQAAKKAAENNGAGDGATDTSKAGPQSQPPN